MKKIILGLFCLFSLVACNGGDAIFSQQITIKVKAVTLHGDCSWAGCSDIVVTSDNHIYYADQGGPIFQVGHCYSVYWHQTASINLIETDSPITEVPCK